MGNDINLRAFPSNKDEALTMLYLQNQDLSNKSPEELTEMYCTTLEKIKEQSREIRNRSKKSNLAVSTYL